MGTARILYPGGVIGAAVLLAATLVMVSAWQAVGQTLQFDDDDLTGVVAGPNSRKPACG